MGKAYGKITVDTRDKGAKLNDLFGIFFEDINHAADGGLYAELVQNRSFEFDPIDNPAYNSLTAWEKIERGVADLSIAVEEEYPLNERNEHYLVIDIKKAGEGAGVMNTGYNSGIPIKAGRKYFFSCYALGDIGEPLTVALESSCGKVYDKTEIISDSQRWKKHEACLVPDGTDDSALLTITSESPGRICLDMVSLFPEKTFRLRKNGMRSDIAELLCELKPKFMRFPGGCLVHEGSLDPDARNSMYRWKNTLGDVAQRPSRRNNWNYNQTMGLGFYEYFLFCEDIGAKAVPVLPAGYNPHNREAAPISELGPWIDDALDLIEFANGNISTEWGAKRAELGHSEPFGLKYIAIGNEEQGEEYFERYDYFHDAIKAKYPEMKIINTGGPFAVGAEYERGWKSAKEKGSDFVDEHYYTSPEWLLGNYHRYDDFDPKGPKVFIGEYATWGNTVYNALSEAAYMTGMERNAQVVGLACYAPMLCNVGYENWRTNLIWFDNHRSYGTPNYYVQKLFMHNQGDRLLKSFSEGLDLPVRNGEEEPISGGISFSGNETSVKFSGITVKDSENGVEKTYPDITLDEKGNTEVLGCGEMTGFALELKAKRISGSKGFIINFGEKDKNNFIEWRFGGWGDEGVLVHALINGRGTCLISAPLLIESDREYALRLEVEGRHIKGYVNGELLNETVDRLANIKPLYFSATFEDATGHVLLKAVNVSAEEAEVDVIFEGMEGHMLKGSVTEIAGFAPEAKNSLENPENVTPSQRDFTAPENVFKYVFPKYSVTVFRIKK